MFEYDVVIKGPNSYFEFGRIRSNIATDAYYASEYILSELKNNGYIQLHTSNDGCIVVFKESIMGFTVNPVEEETE